MAIDCGRAVAFVVGDDNQGTLAEAGREQCQHVNLLKLTLLAEVRGALLVGGDGAVATDDELRGILVFSCEERYGPDHQFRQVFLRAIGDCALVAQRDPAISVKASASAAVAVFILVEGHGLGLADLLHRDILGAQFAIGGTGDGTSIQLSADIARLHDLDIGQGIIVVGCYIRHMLVQVVIV